MLTISVSLEFSKRVPQFKGAFLEVTVQNSATSPELWAEIEASCEKLQADFTTDTIKSRSSIAATRAAYKACGKDPSRYRPASEQLSRRVLQGKGLYSVDTLVDLGNLVSIFSGYPTGLLDADKIVLSPTTSRLLFIINGYDGDEQLLQESIDLAQDLLQRYAHAGEARIVNF